MHDLVIIFSAFGGGLAGGLVGQAIGRWPGRQRSQPEPVWVEPEVNEQIDYAARDWAQTHGRTGSEGLVADKLRLAHQLREQRDRRWRP